MVSIADNSKKFVYLAAKYPKHKLSEIMALMQLPGIDLQAAVYRCVDLGWLKAPDKDAPAVLSHLPELSFGEEVHELKDRISYVLKKLGDKEQDAGEELVAGWCGGYPSHDVIIALSELMREKVIDTYLIKDPDDATYTFYALTENIGKDWGKKQFKSQKKLIVRHN